MGFGELARSLLLAFCFPPISKRLLIRCLTLGVSFEDTLLPFLFEDCCLRTGTAPHGVNRRATLTLDRRAISTPCIGEVLLAGRGRS